MKYSLDPFRWLSYIINRICYRNSKWVHFYASVPYNKKWFAAWAKRNPIGKQIKERL